MTETNLTALLVVICTLFAMILAREKDEGVEEMKHYIHARHDEVPRVKIKVFRGPNKEKDGQQFATWGYWVKQPTKAR